jgi:hypothetical protein
MAIHLSQYPALTAGGGWGTVRWTFELCDTVPDPALVTNINLIPKVGQDWVALYFDDGEWGVPGGTREPGKRLWIRCGGNCWKRPGPGLSTFTYMG